MQLTKWNRRLRTINHFKWMFAGKNGGPIRRTRMNRWLHVSGIVWNWKDKSYSLEFRRYDV
jgi:hypothetical protein